MSIPFERSFASHEKSAFWSSKNEKKPEEVYKSSGKKYWFECHECNHEFESQISGISIGRWCSYCSSKKLCDSIDCEICFNKSFASHEKSVFWSKKNDYKTRDIFKSTGKKYWFDCPDCSHTFDIPLNDVINNHWCSYCSNTKLCDKNECVECFNKSFASHEKSIFWNSKNEVNPRYIFKSSNKKYYFDCSVCNHLFKIGLDRVIQGNWCSYCSHTNLCENNDCQFCFNNSFASHEKSKYWSIKNQVNPRYVFKSANKKYDFNCGICEHSFDITLNDVTTGYWCSYCSSKKLCDSNDCKFCFNKSLASNEKSKYWSSKNECKPRDVFKSSINKYIFDCYDCKHGFEMRPSHITNGTWCPYCAVPSKKVCQGIECQICFNKSFASHGKSKYWSSKNDSQPRDVFKSSNNKYIFDCNKCNNDFTAALDSISRGTWCPFCINKTEAKLYEKLITIYPSLHTQFRQDWCMKKSYLPFDFCIQEYKIIIELDGRQHFRQVSNWSSPEEQQENDKYKEECANQNGYSVIRLLQEDVFYDTYDWVKELCEAIEQIKSSEGITNIYLSKNGEYENY